MVHVALAYYWIILLWLVLVCLMLTPAPASSASSVGFPLYQFELCTRITSASSIELDLSGLTQFEGTRPVKVKTFLHPTIPDDAYVPSDVTDDARHNMARFSEDAAGRGVSYDMGNFGRPYGYGSRGDKVSLTLRVVMVDTAGTIVTVFLSYENGALVPVSTNASIRGGRCQTHASPFHPFSRRVLCSTSVSYSRHDLVYLRRGLLDPQPSRRCAFSPPTLCRRREGPRRRLDHGCR